MSVASVRRRQAYRLPREQRIADIMEAARAVFAERGYDDAAMSEIAARLGIVEGTIYRYFPSKRDLLVRVIEHWFEGMLADYDQQLKGIAGTWNRLRFMIWRHLRVIYDEPALCRLMFNELREGGDYRQSAVFRLASEYTRRTLSIIEDAVAKGEFRANLPLRLVRDMIYGGIEHHSWAYLRGEGDFSPEEAADAITDLIYRGMAVDRPEAPQLIERLEAAVGRLERVTRQEQVPC